VADINDRLDRLNRREEFARRAYHSALPLAPDVDLDDDFVEVLVAVARVVQRHPGLSVMVAPADGRPGRTVIRVSERAGSVESAVVPPPVPREASVPRPEPERPRAEPVRPWAQPAAPWAEPAAPWAEPEYAASNGGRHSDDRLREPATGPPGGPEPGQHHRGGAERPAPGLVTLTDETSRRVARLAQMLREDPSLASGWVRERSP
jgi:hypothetical protein